MSAACGSARIRAMARIAALVLLIATCSAVLACGGDDDSGSPTASGTPGGDGNGSDGPSETVADEAWTGELSGALSGTVTNTLVPQCAHNDEQIAVTLQGLVNGQSAVLNILSGGPGAFDMTHPADEGPTIDLATSGDEPGEWYAAAGASGEGELVLEEDGSGSAEVTLPTIVTGNQPPLTITANWTCPAS